MSTPALSASDLVPVAPPPEPRALRLAGESRRVNNLTLIDGKTFLATTVSGDIAPAGAGDIGLFHEDTRFLSHLELHLNGHRAVVLSAASQHNIASHIELTTANLQARDNLELPENTIHIRREQLLAGAFFDRLVFRNFNLQVVELEVEVLLAADFADVFQVRGMLRRLHGTHYQPITRPGMLLFAYRGRDEVFRQTCIRFDPPPAEIEGGTARYHLRLEPGRRKVLTLEAQPRTGEADFCGAASRTRGGLEAAYTAGLGLRRAAFGEWQGDITFIESSDDRFNRCLEAAVGDFFSLRVPFARRTAEGQPDTGGDAGEIVAAGIPWFATIFGRDSLIAGYQSLLLHPRLASETLRYLATHQGRVRDDWRDEEPGKILHELREGEMTRAGEMPHSPYYGSVDSTPLFLVVLDETFRWTGDGALLEALLPSARRAMEWIENCGDRDGDGFVEYARRSPQGLANQGWKDSWDAYLDRNGQPLAAPLALCEVQGYCYDARFRLARLLEGVGDLEGATRLRVAADALRREFERVYWLQQPGIFSAALDASKRPQQAVGSNVGHLLWSRILTPESATAVANRLMQPDMYSGWGIRTLASSEPTYNPLSYHRGSIWPHDNSLIAQGFAFYGMRDPLLRVFTGLYQAATYFRDLRLPELFCGTQRTGDDEPVHYPVSCSPQAWASGAWFLMLQACLGLRPAAARHELRVVNPVLPDWLSWLRLHRLRVGGAEVSLEFHRRGNRTACNVLELTGDRLSVVVDFSPQGAGE